MKSLMLAAVLLASTGAMAQSSMPNSNDRNTYDPYGTRTQEQERLRNPNYDARASNQDVDSIRTSRNTPDVTKQEGTTPAGGNPGTLDQPRRE
ncbi:hypothetical protein [Bdellovibrio sp. HCB2-146]|uniref:hypothetical protein n=1 Tax=Bdellovibrio sp. HCB2-146 TaxID=3394362 RepID=UPI0039BCDAD9